MNDDIIYSISDPLRFEYILTSKTEITYKY